MENHIQVREFTIVIVAGNHNPTILNPDFLKFNRIVPEDWEIKMPPVCIDPLAEISFKNGVNIRAQLDKLTFFEKMPVEAIGQVAIPEIAKKYANVLPHVGYSAVGLNFNGHVSFEENPEGPQKYIMENIIAEGPWRECGKERSAAITFTFELGKKKLNLSIKHSYLIAEKNIKIPVILIESNFHFPLLGKNQKERLDNLYTILDNWKESLEEFKNLIQVFFKKEASP